MKDFLVLWALPVVMGSVIGYFTNWLAIKMLFRPLKEVRVFGLRLPFTPGILPRGRARIAEGLGDVVANELLTPEVVSKRLRDPMIEEAATGMLDSVIGSLLDTRVGDLAAPLGIVSTSTQDQPDPLEAIPGGQDDAGKTAGEAGQALLSAFRNFLSGPSFARALESALQAAVEAGKALKVSDIVGPEQVAAIIGAGLSDANIAKMVKALCAKLRAGLNEGNGGAIGAFLAKPSVANSIEPVLDTIWPMATAFLRSLVKRPEIRYSIESLAERAISDTIARLNALQRFIVSAARYDEEIIRAIPETVDSLVAAAFKEAESSTFRRALAETMRRELASVAERPLSASLGEKAVDSLEIALGTLLEGSGTGEAAGKAVAKAIEENPDATIGDLLETLDSKAMSALGSKLGNLVRELFAKDGATGVATTFLARFLESVAPLRLGELFPLVASERAAISRVAARVVLDVAARESGRILHGLDLRSIVKERIDSLDMLAVENLLLRVISRELKWITRLGGLLGALIGASQGLVSLFLP